MSKHYNAANVWGRIIKLKPGESKRGNKFLTVHLDCAGQTGNVFAYGRIFGKQKIEDLTAWHKKNPQALVRFRGFFSQYEKRGEKLTNFTFFKWDPESRPDQRTRAAFVLTGEVKDIAIIGKEGRVQLHLDRPGQQGYDNVQEDFELWVLDPAIVEEIEEMGPGGVIECKGFLQQGAGEDDFGSATGPVKPYVLKVRIVLPY